MPEAPPVTVSQGRLLVADQLHPAPVVTVTVSPATASPSRANERGATVNEQPEACEIANVRPATVIVPVRSAALLSATLNATVPLPVPAAADVNVIQVSDATAVQLHAAAAVTPMGVPVPPAAPNDCDDRLMSNVQPSSWLTVNVLSPTEIAPVRAGPGLAATENVTVPLPVPEIPFVMVSQLAVLAAVQAQVAGAVTAMVIALPPEDAAVCVVGDVAYVQTGPVGGGGGDGGAPACVAVRVWPAMVIVPTRSAPALIPTMKCSGPLPVLPAGAAIEIHGTWDEAVQEQPTWVVTSILSGPPSGPNDRAAGKIEKLQLGAGGAAVDPSCSMMAARPATVTVPDRAAPAFADTSRTIRPDPVRAVPSVTAIQLADETAVQPHPSAVETRTSADVAAAPTVCETGVRTTEQPAPCCVSRTATSLMRMSACRGIAAGFGAALNWI